MSSPLQELFKIIREKAKDTPELGNAFEKVCKVFLENDATQTQQYSKVWHYKDWAQQNPSFPIKDTGIDLVAELRDGSGLCAIQSKFYSPEYPIKKEDLDSFISASSSDIFVRLLLIDTSTVEVGKHADSVLRNLNKEYLRIQMSELEECRIDWLTYIRENRIRLHSQKNLREHQIQALDAVEKGLQTSDRGKLVLACGTGKTFTSLRIAEKLAGKNKCVLYMVPSLALMSQTIREWKNDAVADFTAFSACSDIQVGRRTTTDDTIDISLNDLAFPATTDPEKLAKKVSESDTEKMTVIFSTYHSIDVVSKAQFDFGLQEFDLIICDEAHRTTGATLIGDDESNFVRIHSNDNIKGKKRLYMTATPRIFGETAKKKAEEGEVALASMDDEKTFGETLFYRGFGWAVENNLLTDYKVVVLAVDEGLVSHNIQKSFTEGSELKLEDTTKIIGCYKALAKVGFKDSKNKEEVISELQPMRRALAFCQNIKLSQMFASEFSNVVNEYVENESISEEFKTDLKVELRHVDGTFNAEERNTELNWLKDETEGNICRVLTNARCLSEGVDVPALDAIMFLHPRKSQIDVVQSVGRVMRRSDDKKLGYVILPIAVASGVSPEKALNDNEKYKVVWQILNALRAHDERFDSIINRIGLGEDVSDRLEIVGVGPSPELEATTAVVQDIKRKTKKKSEDPVINTTEGISDITEDEENQYSFVLDDLTQAIKAKIVEKCGTRDYWENWASDIAKIAQQHIIRINAIVLNSNTPERNSFLEFLEEIRDDLNPQITETDAIEMLAQHIITRPVFECLFQGSRFTSENAVSKAMETVLSRIYDTNIKSESQTLDKFYESVKRRAADIVTSTGRQTLILELYDRFFRNAFPLMTQKLGIVYTPIEVVDFIINSVEDVMKDEFNSSLENSGVHILDPFSGTGTFISRLLQSGILSKEQIRKKFKNEIHANEIVLLAYYIACINIEAVYDDIVKDNQYAAFDGMVLTDTFQLYEQDKDMIANLLPDNSERRTRQKKRDIRVIFGNPPYSAGQSSANDNAANIEYPNLDKRIEETYAIKSKAASKKSLYDSYIRAFRWASDRLGNEGVIGFVSNAGWIDGNSTDGFRKCLVEEFSKIYVFHLRGNARTSGDLRRKEKGNVFGEGSRAPIAITILIKNKDCEDRSNIYFYDIGDYLDRKEKLAIISNLKSINSIGDQGKFIKISPDDSGNWLNKGDVKFESFVIIGDKNGDENLTIFKNYSLGLNTNRDVWSYNFGIEKLKINISKMIKSFNAEVITGKTFKNANKNPREIKWSSSLESVLKRKKILNFNHMSIRNALYRPFTYNYVYFDDDLVHRTGQWRNIFPTGSSDNIVICVSGVGSIKGFSCIMSNQITDLDTVSKGQCFPLFLYKNNAIKNDLLQACDSNSEEREYAITKNLLSEYQKYYSDYLINEEDIFYYIYGLLHSEQYRESFGNNLTRELPRIPMVKKKNNFEILSYQGRELSKIHVNFNAVEEFPITIKQGNLNLTHIEDRKSFFRVKQMRFLDKNDKSTVVYNENITIQNIPLEAYDYIVNGKPALEWVMDRQSIKTDKDSGIVNDANDYANETMNNPAYPLELFQKVITVSLKTMEIVKSLPKLDI